MSYNFLVNTMEHLRCEIRKVKSSLIDSKAEMANEAEGASHRERLSEKTVLHHRCDSPTTGITKKPVRLAEMTNPPKGATKCKR